MSAGEGRPRRAGLGFQGGGVLSLKVSDDQLTVLREALRGQERWVDVASIDGAVMVDATQVVYLRVESDEQRVGF